MKKLSERTRRRLVRIVDECERKGKDPQPELDLAVVEVRGTLEHPLALIAAGVLLLDYRRRKSGQARKA
ncbi:MAG: hypothetical protein H6809_03690 [Phycisphaeraceae bacterium]|nr:hypothetical protein [Phycisphaeraceae bacterium]